MKSRVHTQNIVKGPLSNIGGYLKMSTKWTDYGESVKEVFDSLGGCYYIPDWLFLSTSVREASKNVGQDVFYYVVLIN